MSGRAHASAREVADDPALYDYDVDEVPCPTCGGQWPEADGCGTCGGRGFVPGISVTSGYSEHVTDEDAPLYWL